MLASKSAQSHTSPSDAGFALDSRTSISFAVTQHRSTWTTVTTPQPDTPTPPLALYVRWAPQNPSAVHDTRNPARRQRQETESSASTSPSPHVLRPRTRSHHLTTPKTDDKSTRPCPLTPSLPLAALPRLAAAPALRASSTAVTLARDRCPCLRGIVGCHRSRPASAIVTATPARLGLVGCRRTQTSFVTIAPRTRNIVDRHRAWVSSHQLAPPPPTPASTDHAVITGPPRRLLE